MRAPRDISAPALAAVFPAAIILMAILALVLFGILGVGRGGIFAVDMRYLYVAGEMWERMLSPYDAAGFKVAMKTIADIDSISYAYPPISAPLARLLSSGSLAFADILITALNIVSLGALSYYVLRAPPEAPTRASTASAQAQHLLRPAIALALLVGNPFTAHVFWMGQTTLIAAALVVAAWLLAHRNHDLVAGILLGLSAFKPQLALLFGIWFLLDRRWLLLIAAAVSALLASVPAMLATGAVQSWTSWLSALSDYQGAGYNVAGFKHVFGLQSLAADLGWRLPSLLPLAVVAIAMLYFQRARYAIIWLAGPIFAIGALFIYAHDYDLLTIFLMALPLVNAARGRIGVYLVLAAFAAFLLFPQRLWEHLDLSTLSRLREASVLGLLAMHLVLCRSKPAGAGNATDPGVNSVGAPTPTKAMMAGPGPTT